jgi:transposase InsO family protein
MVCAIELELAIAIVEYISWFNDSRLHENLGDRPPREIEELYAEKMQGNHHHIMKEQSY